MKNSDPIFWPDEQYDLSLKQKRDKNYSDCINILQTQWYQADLDQRFALGDQDIWGMLFPGISTFRRKMFNFNLINAHLQMISGYQRRNRKSTICIPLKNAQQKTADQLTKCLFHIYNRSGAYQVFSDAFEQGALTQGLGFISHYISYTDDPISGDICHRYIDMKSCLFDPYFRKHDMSDARYFWTRQFFDRQEAADLYPDLRDEILSLPAGTYRDDKFYYMPEVYQIQFPNLIAFDEYWYLSNRECEFLVDIETEETQEFTGDSKTLKQIMQMFKGRLKVVKGVKPTVRRTIIVNDKVLVDEPNPYKIDRYPYVPVLAYFTPDTPYYAYKFKGVVRDLRDAQYLFNRRKVTDLDILESQQQGIKMKQGSLVTPDDSMNTGNGRVLVLDKKAQMTDVEQMQIIPPSPVMLEMENMLQDVMNRISGVNETMLGADINDKAGIISMLRNSAGITTLTRLFDQFDETQRLCGEIDIEMTQKNYTWGKIRQIIGEEPTSEFDDKAFLKYGCKIIQGGLTETQQQLQLQQLLAFREQTQIPIPARVIIEASTLQNKDELIKAIEQEQQAQAQQQQQMAQLQMQQMQIDNMTKMGYAHSQDALAAERMAKIETDRAVAEDKLKRAQQEDTHSLLNLIKGIKELEGMDIQHLQDRLNIVKAINEDIQQQELNKQQSQEAMYVQG
ncbi:MAG TPA: hypothetical protein VFJ23_00240 [Candidatus Nitrosotalea sp.]|nr:hypothetical protein [Candidatus Nitrosotalea sp.]